MKKSLKLRDSKSLDRNIQYTSKAAANKTHLEQVKRVSSKLQVVSTELQSFLQRMLWLLKYTGNDIQVSLQNTEEALKFRKI